MAQLQASRDDNALALEIAAGLESPRAILARYELSDETFLAKCMSETFRQQLRAARAYWNSSANTEQRIKIKAQMCVEDALLHLHDIAGNAAIPASQRIDAIGKLARIAGVDKPEEATTGGGAGGFKINIYLGDPGEQPFTVNTKQEKVIDHDEAA